MPHPRAAWLSLAFAACATAACATAAWAQTVTLQGTLAERFGPNFVLETAQGRVLVDGGSDWRGSDWRGSDVPGVGASLTVIGRQTEAGVLAERLILADGREIAVGDAAPDADVMDPGAMAALTGLLAEAGIGAPRLVSTSSRHGHFEAEGPTGPLRIQARRDGKLRRAEGPGAAALAPGWALDAAAAEGIVAVEAVRFTARHIHLAGPDAAGEAQRLRLRRDAGGRTDARAAPPDPDALRRRVEAAGYAWQGGLALSRAHAEVDALNPEGEPVRLRLDPTGEITRERARR